MFSGLFSKKFKIFFFFLIAILLASNASASCNDSIFNDDEWATDCGGSCSPCTSLINFNKEGTQLLFNNTNGTYTGLAGYIIYLPKDYDSSKKYPLLIYFHGAGAVKTGNVLSYGKLQAEGLIAAINNTNLSLPFIIVAPQTNTAWDNRSLPGVIKLLDTVAGNYSINISRVYTTGISLGGAGTNNFLYAYPNITVAASALSGWGNPQWSCNVSKIPQWFFTNENDSMVPSSGTKNTYNSLLGCPGLVDAKLTVYNTSGHNSWNRTYNISGLFYPITTGQPYNVELYFWFMNRTRNSSITITNSTCFSCLADYDKDGYKMNVDCDDIRAAINPGKPEICGNGLDDDCSGGDASCIVDLDGDGRNNTIDCNDTNASIWQNLSGYIDIDADTYTIGSPGIVCSGNSLPSGYSENSSGSDCNDSNSSVWEELLGYLDQDSDTYTSGVTYQFCTDGNLPSGYLETNSTISDCNESNALIWELLPGYLDLDLDSFTDGNVQQFCTNGTLMPGYLINASGADCDDNNSSIWLSLAGYLDFDSDAYSVGNLSSFCTSGNLPSGYTSTSNGSDCNDANLSINPGASEICGNGIDEDCSGSDSSCVAALPFGALFGYSFAVNATNYTDDITGNNHTGIINGSTWVNQTTGGAYSFDGNDYITVNNGSGLDGLSGITVEIWIYNPNLTNYEYAISKRHDSDSPWALYTHTNGNWVFSINSTNGVSTPFTLGKWEYVVGTWNGTVSKIYINGTLKNSMNVITAMPMFPQNSVIVGAREANAGFNKIYFFSGKMGEANVYNRALNATEIAARYNETRSKYQ